MKEEKKTKQEQDGKRGKNSGHGERDDSVYEENLRRLIDKVSKHKMILLTIRCTKEKLERALDISKKKADDAFKYVASLEGNVGRSIKSQPKPGRTEIILRQSHIRPLQI